MTRARAHRARFAALLVAVALSGCRSASELLYEPPIDDPLDGYRGSLAQAGVNTELDWGPKQNLLLSEFKTLKEAHAAQGKRLEQILTENANLKAQLGNESQALEREKGLRAQAEAETELLRTRRRELEARILSLSIEKAKLEQQNLLSRIEALRKSLDEQDAQPTEAAAPPPRNR